VAVAAGRLGGWAVAVAVVVVVVAAGHPGFPALSVLARPPALAPGLSCAPGIPAPVVQIYEPITC